MARITNKKNQKGRPAIPTDIRRMILVESGHRCSIPTCKYPSVVIHHIIPYEICKKHEYENLIALCPNCHTKVHNGDIDRKALKIYKKNARANISIDFLTPEEDWKPKNVEEIRKRKPRYEVSLWYPIFNELKHSNLKEVNLINSGATIRQIVSNRKCLLDKDWYDNTDLLTFSSELSSQFEITLFTKKLLSIRYDYFGYSTGAAHPYHFTDTQNFIINPLIELDISDLFDSPDCLKMLIKLIRKELLKLFKRKKCYYDNDWIESGTGEDWANFKNFNIKNKSLIFTFDEYQVSSYAEGSWVVELPLSKIKKLMTARMQKILFA